MELLKKHLYILVISLITLACSKEPAISNEKQDAFQNLIGNEYNVTYWGFVDFETNETYNLLDSREIDSIYLKFNDDFTIDYTKVEIRFDQGYYGYKQYTYEFKDNDVVIIKTDKYTELELLQLEDLSLALIGEHRYHEQLQTYNIDLELK